MQTEIDPELLKGVVQAGLLATWHRMFPEADEILGGVNSYKKDWQPITHAYSLLYYAQGDTAAALKALRALPYDSMAKSLTAFLLQQSGQHGWRELCREVCAQDGSAAAKDLAAHLLRSDAACPPGALPPEAALSAVQG